MVACMQMKSFLDEDEEERASFEKEVQVRRDSLFQADFQRFSMVRTQLGMVNKARQEILNMQSVRGTIGVGG